MSAAPLIVGAGLAGLLAAHAWPTARVVEAGPAPRAGHRALLRFRSDAVARLTGVDFRRVTVRKSVWFDGRHVPIDLALANRYSRKVLGAVLPERSVWNLAPAERFVAPEDFYERLIEAVGPRISWGDRVSLGDAREQSRCVVSTAPLDWSIGALTIREEPAPPEFRRAGIRVLRIPLFDVDAHQTVYFPSALTPVYRASLTGGTLIVEMVEAELALAASAMPLGAALADVAAAFGLEVGSVFLGENEVVERQRYGKIAPIDEVARKRLLFRLTHELGVYSLGRFATWRNVLLDDVVQDIDVIKRLMRSGHYELNHAA